MQSRQIHSLVKHIMPQHEELLFQQIFEDTPLVLEKELQITNSPSSAIGCLKLTLHGQHRSLTLPIPPPSIDNASQLQLSCLRLASNDIGYLVPNSRYFVWSGTYEYDTSSGEVPSRSHVIPFVQFIDLVDSTYRSRAYNFDAIDQTVTSLTARVSGSHIAPIVAITSYNCTNRDNYNCLDASRSPDIAVLHADGTLRILQIDDAALVCEHVSA